MQLKGNKTVAQIYFWLAVLAIIVFQLPTTFSLVLGLGLGLFFGHPYTGPAKSWTKYLLQISIVGLGFGMNFTKVVEAGKDGFTFTLLSLSAAMGLGYLLGRWLKVDKIISYLISVGTAICGGSAIAAVSQVVKADEKEISVSIGTVFILNAIALIIFPPIGHWVGLSQHQFGIWAAIAIHDTSSVVGASAVYGNEALMIGTTIKLARALWIVPMALLTSLVFKRESSASAFPWFILFFVVASLANTYLNIPTEVTSPILHVAKTGFALTLFLIGSGISIDKLKAVGARPLLQGVLLWVVILVASLVMVSQY